MFEVWYVDDWDLETDEVVGWAFKVAPKPLTRAAAILYATTEQPWLEQFHGAGIAVVLDAATGARVYGLVRQPAVAERLGVEGRHARHCALSA